MVRLLPSLPCFAGVHSVCKLRKKSSMSNPAMKGREMPLLVPGIGWKNIAQSACAIYRAMSCCRKCCLL
ncbi:hypothetical protein COCSUDRAFT_32530 [Coccomyxa subellipsoidea C-169]|uniref:Uncharacterized protein n=1 Tax=Coccomyxa subellipsoidea (strain C-169) TaxID=574566 RepID=I0Z2X0_COCSC|nr:hypothetical protein COCSUDRAFT_32530 [Coccomyxa subellipsoidea C-169]EIE24989.1 hypothetical protein COCSUDRAFT_32530 [Coccomyxa subellipsoidea C-169]|eukprot:XP_005649533.1 hypothetical protein COCSUDRAFT_32530 [Coccomyxa subellipsoidea C-169]